MPLPSLSEQVFQVVKDSPDLAGLWPVDDLETKRNFIEFCFKHELITLQTDLNGRLEGFLFFYRSNGFDGVDLSRPECKGRYVVCDCLWISPEKRGKGTLKRLLRATMRQHREKLLGGEILVFHNKQSYYDELFFSFPKFYRKFA